MVLFKTQKRNERLTAAVKAEKTYGKIQIADSSENHQSKILHKN